MADDLSEYDEHYYDVLKRKHVTSHELKSYDAFLLNSPEPPKEVKYDPNFIDVLLATIDAVIRQNKELGVQNAEFRQGAIADLVKKKSAQEQINLLTEQKRDLERNFENVLSKLTQAECNLKYHQHQELPLKCQDCGKDGHYRCCRTCGLPGHYRCCTYCGLYNHYASQCRNKPVITSKAPAKK